MPYDVNGLWYDEPGGFNPVPGMEPDPGTMFPFNAPAPAPADILPPPGGEPLPAIEPPSGVPGVPGVPDGQPVVPGAPPVADMPVVAPAGLKSQSASVGTSTSEYKVNKFDEIVKGTGIEANYRRAFNDVDRTVAEQTANVEQLYGQQTPEGIAALGRDATFGTGLVGDNAQAAALQVEMADSEYTANAKFLETKQAILDEQQRDHEASVRAAQVDHARLEKHLAEVRQMTVNPAALYEAMDGRTSALTGMAVMAQALLGMNGIKIDVTGQLDKWVERDIARQTQAIETGQWAFEEDKQLYDYARTQATNDADAKRLFAASRIEQAQGAVAMIAMTFSGRQAQASARAQDAALGAKKAELINGIVGDATAARNQLTIQKVNALGDAARTAVSRAAETRAASQQEFEHKRLLAADDAAALEAAKGPKGLTLEQFSLDGTQVMDWFHVDPEKAKLGGPAYDKAMESASSAQEFSGVLGEAQALLGANGLPNPDLGWIVGTRLDTNEDAIVRAALDRAIKSMSKANDGLRATADDIKIAKSMFAIKDSMSVADATAALKMMSRIRRDTLANAEARMRPFGTLLDGKKNPYRPVLGAEARAIDDATVADAPKRYSIGASAFGKLNGEQTDAQTNLKADSPYTAYATDLSDRSVATGKPPSGAALDAIGALGSGKSGKWVDYADVLYRTAGSGNTADARQARNDLASVAQNTGMPIRADYAAHLIGLLDGVDPPGGKSQGHRTDGRSHRPAPDAINSKGQE